MGISHPFPAQVLDASAELPGDRGGDDDGALYRVVSVYRADNGGARVVCYDPRTCAYGRLLLLKERLEELHVGPAPARDADYPAWSRGLVERLELGAEGDLRVGRQPLQPNGLTLDFSLSGHREPRPGAASDAPRRPACKSNLELDFNVSVFEYFDTNTSALLRELDESNRFVQKSPKSTSM